MQFEKRFVVDADNNKIAVQLDIATYKRIWQLLEDHALVNFIKEIDDDESLSLEDAQAFYAGLKKED